MFLSLCAFFCPFTSPPPPSFKQPKKKNIWKKWKKHLEISSFYTTVPKIMIICYTVPEIWCVMDVIAIFHFGLCFSFLPPLLTTPKMKNSKQLKEGLGVSFYASVPKIMIICYTVPDISHVLNVILFFT